MFQPNTVWVAMQLWLQTNAYTEKTQRDKRILLLTEEVIREWSVAPADTPIADIIRLNGVTIDD
jgi:hypothetical protein